MSRIILISFFVLIGLSQVAPSAFPPGVTPCSRSLPLPEYNACWLKEMKTLTPHLAKGIKSMNLPALDPLMLSSLSVDRNLDSLKIKANMKNLKVYGGSNYVLEDLRADPNALTVTMKILIPSVRVTGNYDVQGKLLQLPLSGIGSFNGTFTNIQVLVGASGKEAADSKGINRVNLDKYVIKVQVGDGKIRLKAPPAHTLTAEAAATFFNTHTRLVLDIAKPIIEDTANTVSKALVTRALASVTKEELLPA